MSCYELKGYPRNSTEGLKIILHHTRGASVESSIGWNITQSLRSKVNVGANYWISRTGKVYKTLDPDTSWIHHAGLGSYVHERTIAIELANAGYLIKLAENGLHTELWRGKDKWEEYSDDQVTALIELLKQLCDTFNITPSFPDTLCPEQPDLKGKSFDAFPTITSHSNHKPFDGKKRSAKKWDLSIAFKKHEGRLKSELC